MARVRLVLSMTCVYITEWVYMYMFMYVCMEGFAYRPHDIIFRFAIEQHLRTLHIKWPIYIQYIQKTMEWTYMYVCMNKYVSPTWSVYLVGQVSVVEDDAFESPRDQILRATRCHSTVQHLHTYIHIVDLRTVFNM